MSGVRYREAHPTPDHPPVFPLGLAVLPTELHQTLNYVYLLHLLAVKPDSILPPGKSLLSVLSRPYSHGNTQNSELSKRVETLVHKAFWDKALESLSDPAPSTQLPRLKELLTDVRTALLSLLPPKHKVLEMLSLPLPPTSNLLRSVLDPLREVLQALRSRCAPIHDQQIEDLRLLLEDPLDSNLPQIIVDVSRAILQLCEQMKDDLSQFVLGTMGETQLHEAVVQEAVIREREFILQLWGSKRAQELWDSWLKDSLPLPVPPGFRTKDQFVRCLIHALGTNEAVSCPLPTIALSMDSKGRDDELHVERSPPPPNSLPPPLLFVTPTVLYLQNYLQALVISSSLRALVRIPPISHIDDTSTHTRSERSFEERVWLLLKAEIDGEPSTEGTKLRNLADEVIRVNLLHKGNVVDPAEDMRLRAAVDRTLQPNDPVFMLLQKRLMQALQARLLQTHSTSATEGRESNHVPRYLQSGRRVPGSVGVRPLKNRQSGTYVMASDQESAKLVVKGFDHPVIVDAVSEALLMLQGCINWTERVWGDLLYL
ncbi:hypothetical protein BC835DRAFT_1554084 [Cytidiella melzeri]|nr:hypothetical protein BC835DRAFT_1554084 [Cytidiella melzeri]